MRRFIIGLGVAILVIVFGGCDKQEIIPQQNEYNTIADKIEIVVSMEDGTVVEESDTIMIDMFNGISPWFLERVNYVVCGLDVGDRFELYTTTNNYPDELEIWGEQYVAYGFEDSTLVYNFDYQDYLGMFGELITTLRFKFSDGSEKWLTYPVIQIIDSSLFTVSIDLYKNYSDVLEDEIILPFGSDFIFSVESYCQMGDNRYFRVVSYNYDENGSQLSVGVVHGIDADYMPFKTMTIPNEDGIYRRDVIVQVLGRYGQSEEKTFTIIYN